MSGTTAIAGAPAQAPLPNAAQPIQGPALLGLPAPLADGGEPTDILGMIMALMDRLAAQGVAETTADIKLNKAQLQEAMEKFRQKMEEIARKAEEAKKDRDSGWGFLGDVCDAVCDFVGDVVGEVLGPITETVVDVIRAPIDIVIGMIKGDNFLELVAKEYEDMCSEGKVSETMKGAVRGFTDFYRDIYNAMSSAVDAVLSGENVIDAAKNLGEDMWNSLVNNVLENEDVMTVLGIALKVVAVAGAVASGGVLGPVAAGLLVLSLTEQETGFCEDVFGEKYGPYVAGALALGGAVCAALAADPKGALEFLGELQDVQAVVSGVLSVAAGINHIQNGLEDANALEDSADLMQIMNQMAALQRILDELLGELEERTEDHDRLREGGAQVYQLQGESFEIAAGMRA